MKRLHNVVIGMLLVVFVALIVSAVYSAIWLDGSIKSLLQAIIIAGAVLLGIEPWVRPERIRLSMFGGAVLIVTGSYGGFIILNGGLPLQNPIVSLLFVVGALLVVITQAQIQSAINTVQ